MISGAYEKLKSAPLEFGMGGQRDTGLPVYSRSRSNERRPRLRNASVTQGSTASSVQTYLQKFSSSKRQPVSQHHAPSPPAQENHSMAVFVLLCAAWYSSSALSSTTGKAILTQFRYPVTLTFIQFGFVAVYCLLLMSPLVQFSRLRYPSKAILLSTLPMGMFQVGGHVFSSMAISRIPVSTVHTIKALSPLFTVAAYAGWYGVKYSPKTYISLVPLTVGVMLACSFDMSASNVIGLLCAFGSAIVFVTSNIFFKKIMPSGGSQTSHKLDKVNLLFYSSSMAFLLMIPIWCYYDLPALLSPSSTIAHPTHGHDVPHSVAYYFFMNGTVHFAQNIIAFIILSSTSPVTYSIASLIKRVAVICIAILWFNQSVHPVQGFGIIMTFTGLYMYNNAKSDVEKGEKKVRRVEATRDMMLPTTLADQRLLSPTPSGGRTPASSGETTGYNLNMSPSTSMYGRAPASSIPMPGPPNYTQSLSEKRAVSPTDSYPSPPLSVSYSPPSIAGPHRAPDHQANAAALQQRLEQLHTRT